MVRIASCSVRGLPDAFDKGRNKRRGKLLGKVVESLQKDDPVDAMVLPGGYFVEGEANAYLDLSFEERCRLLEKASFADAVQKAAKTMDRQTKGALLIFGVDTGKKHKDPQGDQLCVAWSADGPNGIGRKVFPTEWEGSHGFVVNVDDFRAAERVVTVGDSRVLLCSCYDGYGVANYPDKTKYIKEIVSDGHRLTRERGAAGNEFRRALAGGLADWRRLVKRARGVAIAIHRFGGVDEKTGEELPFSTSYWRKHGIATASAKLGGWAVAGANFHRRLPRPDVDVLAANRVPSEHLTMGQRRPTHDATRVTDYVIDSEVRIRVFDFD